MKTQSVIILFAIIVATCESTIYFQNIGQLHPSPSYGHVHFVVDTHIIARHMKEIKNSIEHVRQVVKTHAHPSVQTRAENFLKRAHIDIDTVISEFSDLQTIIQGTSPDSRRVKRFLGLLLAMGSLTMSLFNQAEILHLQGTVSNIATRQNHIVDILQEHEVDIHKLKHDVANIKDGFTSLANVVSGDHAISIVHDAENEITMAMSEIRRTLSCMERGLHQLLTNRVPLCFLDTEQMRTSIRHLAQRANLHNLEVLDTHIAAFLQYETSLLMAAGKMHIYTHVPLINRKTALDLMRFNNAPLRISGGVAIQLAPSETILAIGRDGLHTTLTQNDLDHHLKYDTHRFGKSALILNRQINTTCLGAIYSQNFDQMKSQCPIKFLKTSEGFTKLAPNEFIFYTSEPQTIQMKCAQSTTHIAVEHSHHLKMPSDCEISTRTHLIHTGHDIIMEEMIRQWPTHWNISKLLFDISQDTLLAHIKDIHLDSQAPTTPRDLEKLLKSGNDTVTIGAISMALILTVAVLCTFLFLGYRYFVIRRENSKIIPGNDPGGNN